MRDEASIQLESRKTTNDPACCNWQHAMTTCIHQYCTQFITFCRHINRGVVCRDQRGNGPSIAGGHALGLALALAARLPFAMSMRRGSSSAISRQMSAYRKYSHSKSMVLGNHGYTVLTISRQVSASSSIPWSLGLASK